MEVRQEVVPQPVEDHHNMDHGIGGVVKWYAGRSKDWKRLWGKLWDGTEIYVVDGPYVREQYFVDYVEGGHGYVYTWIPKNEIWIEDMMDPIDQALNLLHEIYEYTLMKYTKIKTYDEAHKDTALVESLIREAMANKPTLKKNKPAYKA